MEIYKEILQAKKNGQKLLAVLIDPEKMELIQIPEFIQLVNQSIATHIFVGGSTDENNMITRVVLEIKKYTKLPIVLFPGNANQVTHEADGILFLSLISGRNPTYLIEQQIESALYVKESKLEVIPTGYILIEGGKKTAVERVSNTKPIDKSNSELILKTALAGEFLGKKLIYLEAGSGALHPVGSINIQLLAENISVPLLVGGGIKTIHQLNEAYDAGADLVIIGTAFENDALFFNELKKKK